MESKGEQSRARIGKENTKNSLKDQERFMTDA